MELACFSSFTNFLGLLWLQGCKKNIVLIPDDGKLKATWNLVFTFHCVYNYEFLRSIIILVTEKLLEAMKLNTLLFIGKTFCLHANTKYRDRVISTFDIFEKRPPNQMKYALKLVEALASQAKWNYAVHIRRTCILV